MLFGRLLEKSRIGGIGANAVVVAVRSHQSPVKAHVLRLESGHEGKLGAQKVLFPDPVFLIENAEQIFLHRPVLLVFRGRIGNVSQPDIEVLAADSFPERLGVLLRREMRQQIADIEHGIAVVFADSDAESGAVRLDDRAVQGEGDRRPLIFAQTAVVMGFGEGDAVRFV